MATVTNKHDGFLCCNICEKMFKRPCNLTCGHTACRGCLEKYKDQKNAKSFHCPKCSQVAQVTKTESLLQHDNIRTPNEAINPNSVPALADHGSIDIRTASDKTGPCPVDVTVVDVGGIEVLVVSDHVNECIKAFYSLEQKVRYSSLQLTSHPQCVTSLSPNQVAVTLLSVKQIVIVGVTPDPVLLSNIKTHTDYYGLTALNDSTLVASCHFPLVLDIIDLTGQVLRSFVPDVHIIQYPCFLCISNDGNILVTDLWSDSLYSLTPEGDVVFKYYTSREGALRKPRGITTTSTGDILVADFNNNVTQLTSTGQFVRTILTSEDGIKNPSGICLHKDKLYVAEKSSPVKIFHLSKLN